MRVNHLRAGKPPLCRGVASTYHRRSPVSSPSFVPGPASDWLNATPEALRHRTTPAKTEQAIVAARDEFST
jgi:hypothetical protein